MIVLIACGNLFIFWERGTDSSNDVDHEDYLSGNQTSNYVKSPNFEKLSDWILFGNQSRSYEQGSDSTGLVLYNNIHGSNASEQVIKQEVYINQNFTAPVIISLWSKANLILPNPTTIKDASFPGKFCLYADLELQSGRRLWGYLKMLSVSSAWNRTDLILDLAETSIKAISLYVMFKTPGTLQIRDLSVVQTAPQPVFHVNTAINLTSKPLTCIRIPDKTMPTPLLVSAVILNWRRPVNLIAIVCSLIHYPFITEVLIWNNNLNLSLQLTHFQQYNEQFVASDLRERGKGLMKKIRIMNSPNNVHDLGRWVACSRAQNPICYIQDDDYEHCYLNSLYANLQMSPDVVHTVSMPAINLEQRRWMLWRPEINLHAAFAWLGAGSFVPRQFAERFLSQLLRYSFEAQQLLYADMIFSLWTNNPAYKLSVPLKTFYPGNVGFSDTHNHWKIFFYSINRASRILNAELQRNSLTDLFNTQQSKPLYDDRITHTACWNDRCLLITNHQILTPLKSSMIYNSSLSVREQDDYYPSPTYTWFDQYGYFNAVDGNKTTFWQIVSHLKNETFFFGLDLLQNHLCQSIDFFSPNWTENATKHMLMSVSKDGQTWQKIESEILYFNKDPHLKYVHVRPLDPYNTVQPYRFFRIEFGQLTLPLFVAEIEAKCTPVNQSRALLSMKKRPMVTAIFVSWIRFTGWPKVLRHMAKYEFVNEFIFWNNNPNVTFNHSLLSSYYSDLRTDISLRIINSNANLYFFARFIGCGMAKNSICFFQDDDWQIDHLNSLYQNYLRYPHMLHTYTNPFVHYLCWSWSYMDASVNMHTSFNWVGTGALTSKANVLHFIETTGRLLPADHLIYADMFFSTWFNDHPYQLSIGLNEINDAPGFSAGNSGIARNKLYIWIGSNILRQQLSSKASNLFPREQSRPVWEERDVRSPCGKDDCLFLSNIHPFPPPRQVTTNFTLDFDGRAMQFVNVLPKTQYNDWLTFPFHQAVDSDEKTCYYVRNSTQGHYVGLDLFSVQLIKYLYIRYEGNQSGTDWLKQFLLEYTSDRDTHQWQTVDQLEEIHPKESWIILSFPKALSVELFRLKCRTSSCSQYKLCHLSIHDDFRHNPCSELCAKESSTCSSSNAALCRKCFCD